MISYNKKHTYYSNIRLDILERITPDPSLRVLEIGCGTGATGALALKNNICGEYYGVELAPLAGQSAKKVLTGVVVGDIEKIKLPWAENFFDVLILSEVLEHLVNPNDVLSRLRLIMKSGSLIFASSPNVSHYSVIGMLLKGRWDMRESGTMDCTHLRWFTPNSYRDMFTSCGFNIHTIEPLSPISKKARIFNFLTLHKFNHLFWRQINIVGGC